MELVGRAVKKRFPGFGTFSGVVESYDPSAGYFKVVYEDGDSEEVDYEEIALMLMEMSEEAPPLGQVRRGIRGRPPKKRRRSELDFAGGEDLDLGSGRFVGVGSIEEVVELVEQNGAIEGNGGKDSVLVGNGGRFDGISKENGVQRVGGEVMGNGDCPNEEASGNASSEGFVGTPQTVKLEAEGGLGDAEEYGIGVERTLEYAMENAYQKGSIHTKVEELKYEICDLGGVSLEIQRYDCSCYVEKDDDGTKKRRRLSGKIYSVQDMPLRRSARKASAASLSPSDPFPSRMLKSESRFQNCILGEKDGYIVPEVSKPALPPSSSDLDLHELPILDFFSVYTFLRSFSRVLFLSPFSLEMFLAVLRCNFANSLIDHIHFSILQTLKQHLEFLSEEGSQPAIECLRTLNWELLDLVTWPVYLAGYLLTHGSTMKSLVKLMHPNVTNTEYYTKPASVKLEMLRCLCDNVMEVEGMRSELNIRMTERETNMDAYNNVNRNRNGLTMNGFEGSLAQEMPEETADGNSDDCCLCRMDGSLICCDGCPAAFHSRCVGVAKDLLPEGDWYCPECLADKCDGLTKLSKSSRGAEVLGVDPHGCLYFSSCGYLLISDSFESIGSCHFYNKDDLGVVIGVLKSSHASYTAIVNALSAYWGISFDSCSSVSCCETTSRNEYLDAQLHSEHLLSSFQNVANDDTVEKNSKDNCTSSEHSGRNSARESDLSQTNVVSLDHASGMSHPFASLDPAEQLAHAVNSVQLTQQTTANCSMDTDNPTEEVFSLKLVDVAIENSKCFATADQGGTSFVTEQKKVGTCQLQSDPGGYINYYIFGRVALSVAADLMRKSSEGSNKEPKRSDEDMMLAQLKAISKRCLKSSSYSFLKLSLHIQKEKCGWCHSCKTSSNSDCIFIVNDKHFEGSKECAVGLRSEKKKKSHIVSAMLDILSIEDRLNGLLSGPWQSPHYSSVWRKAVMKASDVSSLKHMLLILESNLRRVAMSSDWMKLVDSAHTVGSAYHILIGSMNVLSNYGGRRQAKKTNSGSELNISQAAAASYVCWWRGGLLSRQVFRWKMLPRSLASKGGRQAGCKKISNVFYPDGTEFARRSKFVTWRAAVEMSKTVAQLAFLIKEFDSNIRWLELSKTPPFSQLTKESKSLARLFKKVIIRRKCTEGTIVRYLLDFGKRENIPAIVTRNGVVHEDPSSERKKFWLSENHVPLYLIKAFEAKKLARSMKKMGSNSKSVSHKTGDFSAKKSERLKGLSYLITKAEMLGTKLCGQCNKNVLIREAVNCQLCDGSFHRKHFRVPKGAITTNYICYRCKDKKSVKVKTQRQKVVSQKKKKSSGKKSKILPKRRKRVLVKSKKKPSAKKKRKQNGNRKDQSKRCENSSCRKRKRTTMLHSFWLNGLRWTRKADDERGKHFRKTKVVLPYQRLIRSSRKPVCCLCLKEYNSEDIYVSCENCKDWFHGDVYSLAFDEINNLIGFKCHKCRGTSIPMCPFSQNLAVNEVQLSREFTIAETVTSEGQDVEQKLHSGTFEGSSTIEETAGTEGQDVEEKLRGGTFEGSSTIEETIGTEGQDVEGNLNSGTFRSSSTIMETVSTEGQDVEEKLHSGTFRSSYTVAENVTSERQDAEEKLHSGTFKSSSTVAETVTSERQDVEEKLNSGTFGSSSTITETVSTEGQDVEEKLHNGTFTSSSTIAKTVTTEAQDVEEKLNSGTFGSSSTIAGTVTTEGQDVKEKLHSGTFESSPIVHDKDYLYQHEDGFTCVRDEDTFTSKTESGNGPYNVQSLDPADEKFTSCKHDNDFDTEAASQEMGDSSNEMVIVQELLVAGALNHSEGSHRILSGSELVDVEGAKT